MSPPYPDTHPDTQPGNCAHHVTPIYHDHGVTLRFTCNAGRADPCHAFCEDIDCLADPLTCGHPISYGPSCQWLDWPDLAESGPAGETALNAETPVMFFPDIAGSGWALVEPEHVSTHQNVRADADETPWS